MSKSKSRPCQHPRTAVTAGTNDDLTATVYRCKKCGKSWEEVEPLLEVSDVPMHELQGVLASTNETSDSSDRGADSAV